MRAITLTALFITAMAMSNISSAASTHQASMKAAYTGTQLNNDEEDDRSGLIIGPPMGQDWWRPLVRR